MKPFHLIPTPTVRMKLAWYRAADRKEGRHPDALRLMRKGNHEAVSASLNARPGWRNTPDRMIALFTPKATRRKQP
jgi:hypothetical protein